VPRAATVRAGVATANRSGTAGAGAVRALHLWHDELSTPKNGRPMDTLKKILHAHPHPASDAGETALECIYACAQCAQVCSACADACISEPNAADLTECIRLDQDCADVCDVTARLLARAGHRDRQTLEKLLEACIAACRACAAECGRHAEQMEHCAICADSCRACVEACEAMAQALVA
jgi:hypothetical protein